MKALVTRPVDDAPPVAALLRARGIEPVAAPMLRIVPEADGAARLGGALIGVQGVLFTSANGVRAYTGASRRFELPAFCVGDASAAAARMAGFRTVFSADGDIGDLAALVGARLAPHHGALLHAAGAETAGDLPGDLDRRGFTLRRVILYRAIAADSFPPGIETALRQSEIAMAVFFSPRAAATFVRLAREAFIGEHCETMTALALSPNVAAALSGVPWRATIAAAAPTLASLAAALDTILAGAPSA